VHHHGNPLKTPLKNEPERILVVGRSPDVLVDTVEILRSKGFFADATNQFDRILDDYDVTNLDILVFGGMVPPDTKKYLREEVGSRNPEVTFVQGLAGIAGLIAAQVEGVAWADPASETEVSYDAVRRTVKVNMHDSAHVTVDAYWHTSFTPPQPRSTTMQVLDTELDKGLHTMPLPAEVPSEASFVTVAVGAAVHAFTVGPMPQAVMRMVSTGGSAPAGSAGTGRSALPSVAPITTHGHD
jgi:hypothetical protein